MRIAVVIFALVLLASGVMAGTPQIDTYPCWDGNVTIGWGRIAQSFVAPAGTNLLSTYTFGIDPESTVPTLTFEIYVWSTSSGPVGSPLFSVAVDWPDGGDVVIPDIGLTLTDGVLYGAVVDLGSTSGPPSVQWMQNIDCYSDGDASWWNGSWQFLDSGWSTKFQATFDGATPVEHTTWGRIKSLY